MACVFEEGPDDRFETVRCDVAECRVSRVARGDSWILDKDPSMDTCQEPAAVNQGEIMDEKIVTPSMMPRRLHEGVIKLSEEELCKERATIDALELLKQRETKQRIHDERRARTRAVASGRLEDEARKEAHIAKKNSQKERRIEERKRRRFRGKK